MSKWQQVELRAVVSPVERAEAPMPGVVYRQIGVRLWGEGVYEREQVDGARTRYARLYRTEAGDIIINKIWARNGSVAVVPDSLAGCFGSGEFPMFTPLRDRLEPRWMHWLAKTRGFWAQCDEKSRGTSGKNRIRPEQFLSVEIPVPPLVEQRRVLTQIEELCAKIGEATQLRDEAVKEAEMLLARTAECRFSNILPRVNLGEVCVVITDGTHQTPRYTEEGSIFLSAQNVKPFRFIPEVHRKISFEDFAFYTARNKPRRGDVLLTRVGAGIGEAAVVDQDIDFAIYVSLALIRPDPARLSSEFLVHWLNSPEGRSHSGRQTLGRGHSQGNLNLKLLREFKIPLPALLDQHQIVSELDALWRKIDLLKRLQTETAVELQNILPSILDRAFKGEL